MWYINKAAAVGERRAGGREWSLKIEQKRKKRVQPEWVKPKLKNNGWACKFRQSIEENLVILLKKRKTLKNQKRWSAAPAALCRTRVKEQEKSSIKRMMTRERYEAMTEVMARKYKQWRNYTNYREFDPGSGLTLAACITHSSRTDGAKHCVFCSD